MEFEIVGSIEDLGDFVFCVDVGYWLIGDLFDIYRWDFVMWIFCMKKVGKFD